LTFSPAWLQPLLVFSTKRCCGAENDEDQQARTHAWHRDAEIIQRMAETVVRTSLHGENSIAIETKHVVNYQTNLKHVGQEEADKESRYEPAIVADTSHIVGWRRFGRHSAFSFASIQTKGEFDRRHRAGILARSHFAVDVNVRIQDKDEKDTSSTGADHHCNLVSSPRAIRNSEIGRFGTHKLD
jgi:hypothetical protein